MKNANMININGVSYNADAVSKMSYKQFIDHPMHVNHYLHLKSVDKPKAIEEAWQILKPKKDVLPIGDDTETGNTEVGIADNSTGNRKRNGRRISEF